MARSHAICISSVLLLALFLTCANAATFDISNNCPYTVWAAVVPGGGRRLDPGQSWSLDVSPGTEMGRIWARTNCQFDAVGKGKCQTGDCGGDLECTSYGQAPNTLAEYALNFGDKDFFDISLVDGFNVPMDFNPTSNGCNRGIECTADINGQCPAQLKAPGGCNNPCPVFRTDEYCCTFRSCGPTNFSEFFKDRCPDAYGYPKDNSTSTFTCPDLDIIVHTLWQIWKARNSFVFRRAHPDPTQVVRTALANALTDRRLCAASPASQLRSFSSDRVWHPPIPGTWKVNIDGAFIPASSEGTVASITRDHAGRIVDGFSSHVAASTARGIGLSNAGGCGQQILPSAMGASLSAC